MGYLSRTDDAARTDPDAERDRAAALQGARVAAGEGFASLTPAQQAEFDEIILLGLHSAENLTGPILGSADVDTYLYDPLTGLPR